MPRRKTTTTAPPRSVTGVELDPADGRPVFADGMSRRRWLEETKDDRKAALVDELRDASQEDDDAPSSGD